MVSKVSFNSKVLFCASNNTGVKRYRGSLSDHMLDDVGWFIIWHRSHTDVLVAGSPWTAGDKMGKKRNFLRIWAMMIFQALIFPRHHNQIKLSWNNNDCRSFALIVQVLLQSWIIKGHKSWMIYISIGFYLSMFSGLFIDDLYKSQSGRKSKFMSGTKRPERSRCPSVSRFVRCIKGSVRPLAFRGSVGLRLVISSL